MKLVSLIELLLLGVIQGVVEWLPISSEGQVVLVVLQFLELRVEEAISIALFLHLGTMLVVFFIYKSDFMLIFQYLIRFFKEKILVEGKNGYMDLNLGTEKIDEVRSLIKFFFWGVLGTAVTGIPILLVISDFWTRIVDDYQIDLGSASTILIGFLLIITGFVLSRQRAFEYVEETADSSDSESLRSLDELTWLESFVVGMCQGFAILPGISRSGMTITALLLLKVKRTDSLRGSFLLLVPASLGAVILELARGRIVFDLSSLVFRVGSSVSLGMGNVVILLGITFLVGYMTIKYFLQALASNKVKFDHFCYVLGIIAIFAGMLGLIL